jgi:Domain of unknown function (DUF6916)
MMIERISEAVFKPHLGEEFTLLLPDDTSLVVTLAETGTFPEQPGSVSQIEGIEVHIRPDPFYLVFRANPEMKVPQGTYPLEHRKLGRIDGLFFVPCYEDAERRDYHVTIN